MTPPPTAREATGATILRQALLVALIVLPPHVALAQTTRAEEIEQARRDLEARLWPERESPLVARANQLVERGFNEGIADGRGASGFQFVLGDMRSGQGVSAGIGWRKTDLWRERLGLRTTARGTIHGAYMLDARLDVHPLTTSRSFFNLYTKYEHSPRMDFYGRGAASQAATRTSFLLRDLAVDFQAGVELSRWLRIGATGGGMHVTTGPGRRSGVPSTSDVFSPAEAPGIAEDPVQYDRWGAFAAVDSRDSRTGPRAGGLYAAQVRQYFDRTVHRYSFRQAEFELQQYFPYFNGTRVVALRVASVFSWNKAGQDVPVYFMPTAGGNDSLRGFARQRFRDNHALTLSAEHRWYVFRGLDMAVFADAGKVVARKAQFDLRNLEFAPGFGFRTRIGQSVIMRTDVGFSREGVQLIWTFSDVFGVPY